MTRAGQVANEGKELVRQGDLHSARCSSNPPRSQDDCANAKATIAQMEVAQAAANAARAELVGERDRTAIELAHSREAEGAQVLPAAASGPCFSWSLRTPAKSSRAGQCVSLVPDATIAPLALARAARHQAQIRHLEGELRAMAAEGEAERGRSRQAVAEVTAQLRAAEESVEQWQERCREAAAQARQQQEAAAAEAQGLAAQIASKESELRALVRNPAERGAGAPPRFRRKAPCEFVLCGSVAQSLSSAAATARFRRTGEGHLRAPPRGREDHRPARRREGWPHGPLLLQLLRHRGGGG